MKERNQPLSDRQMLERDIAGIRESIRLNWIDLDRLALSPDERAGIKQNTQLLVADLKDLLNRIDLADGKNG